MTAPLQPVTPLERADPGDGNLSHLGHNVALDGVRGIAILMVLVHHFVAFQSGTGVAARIAASFIHSAWMGVDLFFVLSGFLITSILLEDKSSPAYFRRFYIRRTLRIFPLYFGVIIVCFGLAALRIVPPHLGIPGTLRSYAPLVLFYTNFSALFSGGGQFGALFAYWSLAVEEHFYLFWPLIVHALPGRWIRAACFGLFAFSIIARCIGVWNGIVPIRIYAVRCIFFFRQRTASFSYHDLLSVLPFLRHWAGRAFICSNDIFSF